MPVITSGPGYNGVTGAKATYDPSIDMWVDTNGERIRTDAIVPGEPPAKAATPAAPTDPGTGGGSGGGGGAAGGAMDGLRSAMGGSTPQAPTMTYMGSPAEGNPSLGQRNIPITALKLALRQGQFGRVY